jgi:hypothetical protein
MIGKALMGLVVVVAILAASLLLAPVIGLGPGEVWLLVLAFAIIVISVVAARHRRAASR